MKSILALTVAGLLASTAVLAQEKMAAPATAPAASTAAPAAAPAGAQPTKKVAHHSSRKKKARKAAMGKDDAGKSMTDTKSEAPSSDMKK